MQIIKCQCGKDILVDDDVFFMLSLSDWRCGDSGKGSIYKAGTSHQKGAKHVYIARLIINVPVGFEPDHINRNRHDNRRENLRIATREQNQANLGLRKTSNSGFKGVSWCEFTHKWRAVLGCKKKYVNLGRFSNILDAAKAYDKAAIQHFGEFAVTNESLGLYKQDEALDKLMQGL